jgi:hypothetical protein
VCSAEVLACAWVQSPSSGLHHNTSAYASTTTAAALKKGHYYQQSPRPPLPRLPPLAALRSCHLGAGETKALSSGRGLFWARSLLGEGCFLLQQASCIVFSSACVCVLRLQPAFCIATDDSTAAILFLLVLSSSASVSRPQSLSFLPDCSWHRHLLNNTCASSFPSRRPQSALLQTTHTLENLSAKLIIAHTTRPFTAEQ